MSKEDRKSEALFYFIRPNNTSIWLPFWIASELELEKRAKLTESQFNDSRVQELLESRRIKEKKEKAGISE